MQGKERVRETGSSTETYINTSLYVKQIASGKLLYNTGSSTWGSLTTWRGGMGWGLGGRFKREETHVHFKLIHVVVWQNPR